MTMRDMKRAVYPAQSLLAQIVTAAGVGLGVDVMSNNDAALATLDIGALGGSATPTVTFQLQESIDNATFTAVAATDVSGGSPTIVVSAANANASTIQTRTYMGYKQYLRWACTGVSGTSPTVPACGQILLGRPHVYIGY